MDVGPLYLKMFFEYDLKDYDTIYPKLNKDLNDHVNPRVEEVKAKVVWPYSPTGYFWHPNIDPTSHVFSLPLLSYGEWQDYGWNERLAD